MIQALVSYQARNLDLAKRLVADLTEAQWCHQPGTIRNHAAWVIGHSLWVADKVTLVRMLKQESKVDAAWDSLFGGKSQPTNDSSKYPNKATLMGMFEEATHRIAAVLKDKPDSLLAQPTPDEPFAKRFPLLADSLLHLMVGHDAMHLGQLSAWRRAQGLPPV